MPDDDELVAYHGDSWESDRFAVTIGDARPVPPLPEWTVRAQAREHPRATAPTFEWTVPGGGIVFGAADIELANGVELTTDTVQLLLRPVDWQGKPTDWSGLLEIEISSDDTDTPAQRRTILRAQPFRVIGDTAR